jgi:hypothetical protein
MAYSTTHKHKIELNFGTLKQNHLMVRANVVLHHLKKGYKGPMDESNINQLEAACKKFTKELARRTTKEAKTASRKELVTILRRIGLLVEEESKGNLVVIYSAGFDVKKPAKSNKPLGEAKEFRLKLLGNGEVDLRCKRNKNAKTYLWEYMEVDGVRWIQNTTKAAKIVLKELQPGKEYRFRVMLLGKSEIRVYSQEKRSFVV